MRVELRHVTKCFGSVLALRDVNLLVRSGEKLALAGPNGSGKSTLIRAIMGMLVVDGEVLFDGEVQRDRSPQLANQIAYVPQNLPSFNASTSELVRILSDVRGLEESAVVATAASLNLDLSEIWKRPVRQLSAGTKQKLMLVLAIAAKPLLLILDEPTASLDTATRLRFLELFEHFTAGITVILCSHRFDEVRQLVRRAVILEAGEIAWEGETSDLPGGASLVAVEVQEQRLRGWMNRRR